MIPLVWTAPAEADLAAIDDYWWPFDPDIAVELTDHIRAAAAFLRSVPAGGAPVNPDGARKWRVARTPYLLLYRVSADVIEIIRIHHDRQAGREI